VRSLLGGVAELLVRNSGGWSSTTYNQARTANPFARGNRKGTSEMDAYGQVSTLFAVVSKIANSTGSVQWRLFREKQDGRRVKGPVEAEKTEIVSHVALDLWRNPNEAYTQSRMVESLQQHIDLCGESRIMIARSPRATMPLELWPIRPDKLEPVPSPGGPLLGYVYTGPNGEKIPLQPDEVIDIIMPNPLDPYRGLGPVQTLLTDLGATKAAAQWNANFFANDATPGGVIEMEENLSDSEWRSFVERWREGHQGTSNAHRIATLEKAKWVNAQFTMRDMQFTELREYSDKTIMAAFGVSPHMLGIEETVNRATAEAAEDVFARWVIKPRLDRIKDALNSQLLPLFGTSTQGLEFDFDDPSLEDSEANDMRLESKARAAKLLVEAGGKFESVLENIGLPAIEFDQEKIDRETKLKEEAEKSRQKALESGPGNSPDQIPSKPKESSDSGKKAA
jgi:HK97 family phage portal protein